jgi:serine protease AprX
MFRTLATAVPILLAISSVAYAGTHSPELERLDSNKQIDVIITYTVSGVAPILRGASRKLSDLPGGELSHMTVAEALRVSADSAVAHVSVNHTLYGTGSSAPAYDFMPQSIQPVTRPSFGLQVLGQGFGSGGPVGVALIDSGVHVDPLNLDLYGGATVIHAESFVTTEGTDDLFGHGTHIAGLIAGTGLNSLIGYSNDIFGVSPAVKIISLKVLDQNGMSTDAQVIQAIDRAIALKNTYNIKVINLSLGRPIYESFLTDPLCQEVEKAWLDGITVVVAAGNGGRMDQAGTNGYGTIAAPGNDPLVLTVGAINTEGTANRGDDLMTTYSSKGPSLVDHVIKPDLVAPGNQLYGILAPGSTLSAAPAVTVGSYLVLSGTSMATGVTSGAAAALIARENLTPDQVKARLMKTAGKLPNATYTVAGYTITNDIFTVGAGYLDLDAAIAEVGDHIPAR